MRRFGHRRPLAQAGALRLGDHIHVVDRLAVFGLKCRVAHVTSSPSAARVEFAALDGFTDVASPDAGRPARMIDYATRGEARWSWHSPEACVEGQA